MAYKKLGYYPNTCIHFRTCSTPVPSDNTMVEVQQELEDMEIPGNPLKNILVCQIDFNLKIQPYLLELQSSFESKITVQFIAKADFYSIIFENENFLYTKNK